MSILLAMTLVGGMMAQDPASLVARVEALEARNRDLEARLERLDASRAAPASQPVPIVVPASAPVLPMVAPVRDTWDVSFVGAEIGQRKGLNQEAYVSDFYAYTAPERSSGYLSLQIGRRWQSGAWVFGGELSASAPVGPSSTELYDVRPPFSSPDAFYHYRRTASVAVSGQFGWAIGNTLIYSEAGIEAAQLKFVRQQGETVTGSDNVAAPFFGVGIAQQIHSDWSVEVEGRYGYSQQGLVENDFSLGLKLNYLVP